jgi:hypothetical protein
VRDRNRWLQRVHDSDSCPNSIDSSFAIVAPDAVAVVESIALVDGVGLRMDERKMHQNWRRHSEVDYHQQPAPMVQRRDSYNDSRMERTAMKLRMVDLR